MKNKKTNHEVAKGIRKRVFEHCIKNNGGYLSQACSAAEQLAWLYNDILNLGDSTQPMIPEEFRGVPSKDNYNYITHVCTCVYFRVLRYKVNVPNNKQTNEDMKKKLE